MGHPMAKKGLRKRGDKVFRTKKSFNENRYSKGYYGQDKDNEDYNDYIAEKSIKNRQLNEVVL
jgi:hypothetical protein